MKSPASAVADNVLQVAGASIPTAARSVARTLPACTVAVIGIPLLVGFVPRDVGEHRVPWELLIILATLGMVVMIQQYAQAPRPRLDEKVARAQWKRAFGSAATCRSLPPHLDVRIAVGVIACSSIEAFMLMAAVLLGTFFGELVRPELSWLALSGGALAGVIAYAIRLRRCGSCLRVLHSELRAS